MLKRILRKQSAVDESKNVITLCKLIANNMQVKFEIAGIQLKESEAKTLLSIGSEAPTVTVDLMDHVDTKLLDSSKLFSLSIEKKHPELATLAAKLAINVTFNQKTEAKSGTAYHQPDGGEKDHTRSGVRRALHLQELEKRWCSHDCSQLVLR